MDLVDIDDISESSILRELESRFQRNEIYSSIGPILVAMNPYKHIPDLYSETVLQRFIDQNHHFSHENYLQSLTRRDSPHVWMVPFNAFQQMRFEGCPQALVISGESGAGKTEATKKCLQLLSALALSDDESDDDRHGNTGIEDRILATNPVLESFGNSKTARNNNSSRFGKWIQINYTVPFGEDPEQPRPQLVGARITQYLLEKSRVCVHSAEERNYHIFYQLCASGIMDIQPAASYRFLRCAKNLKIPGVDDKAEFQATCDSMVALGFTEQDTTTIFGTLKAILLLGNVTFHDEHSSDGSTGAEIGSEDGGLLANAAQILGLEFDALHWALKSKTLTVRGERSDIKLNSIAAQDALNAMCKEIYGRIFSFLVYQANRSLNPSLGNEENEETASRNFSIGLLDIFGFEKFKFNSFEQLCINFANEKLHQYFITYVLKKEQELYESEGIMFNSVVPIDNSDVLSLFEHRQTGIFRRLDDEIKLPRASDEGFLKKVEADHNKTKDQQRRFAKDVKMPVTQFEIRHFAGTIRYDAQGFLEKNKDKLYDHLEELLSSSNNEKFREIFTVDWDTLPLFSTDTSNDDSNAVLSRQSSTISTRFQAQLQRLVDVLNGSQPHFIKCVKPNNSKQERLIEKDVVLLQLRYSGVLEAIQIRKSGYPTRRTHERFWKSYWMLPPNTNLLTLQSMSDAEKCRFIAEKLFERYGEMQVGRTLTFLRPNSIQDMEEEKVRRGNIAIIFTQSYFRMRQAMSLFAEMSFARDQLRDAIEQGQQGNASNVDAIDYLEKSIAWAIYLSLPEPWVTSAQDLLKRLLLVKETLAKLESFSQDDVDGKFADVFEEFNELQKLLDVAQALEISSPQLKHVYERLDVLRDRARCVENLRSAVQVGDDVLIRQALLAIEEQSKRFGSFCEKDELTANSALDVIVEDFTHLDEAMNEFKSFSNRLSESLNGKAIVQSALSSLFTSFSTKMKQKMKLWTNRSPASAMATEIIENLNRIINIHAAWMVQDWANVASLLATSSKSLQKYSDIATKTESMTSSRRESVIAHAQLIDDTLKTEARFIRKDIHSNFLVPIWLNAMGNISRFTVDGVTKTESTVEFEKLHNTVTETRAFTWLSEETAPAFEILYNLIELRRLFVDRLFVQVLSGTDSTEIHQHRIKRCAVWLEEMLATNKFDSSFLDEFEALSMETRDLFDKRESAMSSISSEFSALVVAVRKEIDWMHAEALDRVSQSLLGRVVEVEAAVLEDFSDVESFGVEALVCSLSLVNSLIEESKMSTTCSNSLRSLLSCVTALVKLRRLYSLQQFDALSTEWATGAFDVILSPSFTDLSEKTEQAFETMKFQATKLIVHSVNVHLERQCKAVLEMSPISFSILADTETEHEAPSFTQKASTLRQLIEDVLLKLDKCLPLGEIHAEVVEIVPFLKLVVEARTSFHSSSFGRTSSVPSVAKKRDLLRSMEETFEGLQENEILQSTDIIDKLRREFAEMEKIMHLEHCFERVRQILSTPNLNRYLSPHIGSVPDRSNKEGRPRTTSSAAIVSTSAQFPARAKSLSLDYGLSSPLIALPPGGVNVEETLEEDGFVLNSSGLVITALESCAKEISDFRDEIIAEDEEPPSELLRHLKAVDLLRALRESVTEGDWVLAYKVAQEIKNDVSLKDFAELEKEVDRNWENICNYAAVFSCQLALSRGQPAAPIGQVDFKNSVSTQLLDEAIALCQSVGCRTQRAEQLFNAVLLIQELRTAQKLGDWAEIKLILTRASNEKIGQGLSAICWPEINRAIIEKDNHDYIEALKSAIINEEMTIKDGLLDTDNIAVKELSTAMARANTLADEARGAVLRTLLSLSDTILKARKSAAQKQWFALESLFALMRETIELFQDEIDGKGPSTRRGTAYSRMSSLHRGTMLKNKGSVLGDFSTGGGNGTSARAIAWEEFADLNQAIKREIRTIDHHFQVTALDQKLLEALNEHGICTDPDSGQIDRAAIQVEKLSEVVELASNLDKNNMSLPKHLKALRNVGLMILEIRQAVLQDQWEGMGALLESTLSVELANWPDYNRQELRAVRVEVENRWIIANLNNAIETGKLALNERGEAMLDRVAFSHFQSAISAAEDMHATTEAAILLLAATKKMQQLRKMLVEKIKSEELKSVESNSEAMTYVTWESIKKTARDFLDEMDAHKLTSNILMEVKLIAETAEERIIYESLEQALWTGRPTGEPGAVDISQLTVKELDKAYQHAIRSSSSKTDHAKQLLFICRSLQKLREALQRAEVAFSQSGSGREGPRELASETWQIIRSVLRELLEAQRLARQENELKNVFEKKSMIASVWSICDDEIKLITQHTQVVELRNALIDTAMRASHVYAERNSATISDDLEMHQSHSDQLKELTDELEAIVERSRKNVFKSDWMDQFFACAAALRSYRLAIVAENWPHLEDLIHNEYLRRNLRVLPEVENEIAWIACELHNNSAIKIFRAALNPKKTGADQISAKTLHRASLSPEPSSLAAEPQWDLSNLHEMSFKERNAVLLAALTEAKRYKITSKVAQQWRECCENMYLLRHGLEMRDDKDAYSAHNSQVTRTLRWFKDNAHICPLYVKQEAQSAYVMYQNDLLVHGLTRALEEGKPIGKCGELNVEGIETQAIEALLNQAKDIHPRLPAVEELVKAATLSLSIRKALKSRDMKTLQQIIDEIFYEEAEISLLVVNEVAVARSELDNAIVVRALSDALRSFEDTECRALDLTFLNSEVSMKHTAPVTTRSSVETVSEPNECKGAKEMTDTLLNSMKQPAFSILESFSERRYSFANKNSAHIDPETIDINILDYGLRMAKDHGVFSDQAGRLFRTVNLIRSLRSALKSSEWFKLEETLCEAHFEENLENGVFDRAASKEIQALRSQLEIRAAIVDLSKALKVGWAKCSHGIVDTSQMNNGMLADAIERADHCIVELALNVDGKAKNAEGDKIHKRRVTFHDADTSSAASNTVQQQVAMLMESAKLVLKIREILAMGDIEQAGTLAEEALTEKSLHYTVLDELKLYAKEINAALASMKVIEELRSSMRASKIIPLSLSLQNALKSDLHVGNDLGIICILEHAEKQFAQLMAMRKQLVSLIENEFDVGKLRSCITNAERMNYCDEELFAAKSRLDRLEKFREGCEFFFDFWWRATSEQCRRAVSQVVIDFGRVLSLEKHPLVLREMFLLRTNADVYRSIAFSRSIVKFRPALKERKVDQTANCRLQLLRKRMLGTETKPEAETGSRKFLLMAPFDSPFFNIHTESIRIKRQFLSLSSSQQKYKLENFPKLRRPDDFALRMNVLSEELKTQMLTYTEQPLPTSLTNLPAPWAAIATFIFSNHIRGLEKNIFTHGEVLLQQLVQLGQQSLILRDEILLQILKQLRGNSDQESCIRLWKTMCACLYFFPPSKEFESHLELFLIQSAEPPTPPPAQHSAVPEKKINRGIVMKINNTITVNTALLKESIASVELDPLAFVPFARCAIRCLHQTVFFHGYQHVIPTVWLTSSNVFAQHPPDVVIRDAESLKPWFSDEFYSAFFETSKTTGFQAESSIKQYLEDCMTKDGRTVHWPVIDLSVDSAFVNPIDSAQPLLRPLASLRGTREDWVARFRAFNGGNANKEGGYITRSKFCNAIASTLSAKTESSTGSDERKDTVQMDIFDRDMFYFLLLGKRSTARAYVEREHSADVEVFHFSSDDEANSSASRRVWMETNISMTELASELFFSQLQTSDLVVYAERFWDGVIVRMSRECLHFPFLHWERNDASSAVSSAGRKQSTVAGSEVSMSWELYRELVLTAMKKHLELFQTMSAPAQDNN